MTYELLENPGHKALITEPGPEGPEPIEFHELMPGYAPTPLWDCPELAERLGVQRVLVKDESVRLELPSFKMLGASWAVATAVQREWLGTTPEALGLSELASRIPDRASRRLAAATDGNHGRGVARMAKLLGLGCSIFVPAGTADSRICAIESEGAGVTVVAGSYDDAIVTAAREADELTLVISDTSWDGYEEIPRAVGRGYSTLFREVDLAFIREGYDTPTTVALQAGVGSFAAAGLAHYRSAQRATTARHTVIVEPRSANCLMVSAREGKLTEVPGPHTSSMAGLNCGLGSQLAWPVISASTDVFVAIGDDASDAGMRLLAQSGVVAGESGAAALGALLAVSENGSDADRLAVGLEPTAIVLIVNTEGATDPVNYLHVVGRSPEQVEAGARDARAATTVTAW